MNAVQNDDPIVARGRERAEREADALALVLARAELSIDDVETAECVLRKLALVELDDLQVAPGFNLLCNGEVGSVNDNTPEWQFWSDAKDFIDDANHLEIALFRARRRAAEGG